MNKMLTWSELEKTATENNLSAYLCCDTFQTVKKDVKEDNPDITVTDHKTETMWRLLYENLDYGKYNEIGGEPDDIHSKNMAHRSLICDKVAEAWCRGEIDTVDKAQNMVNEIIKE